MNSAGPWATVRVDQPYEALASRGWDVRFVIPPFDPVTGIRQGSLVIWQRPLPASKQIWQSIVNILRKRDCLILVEWDDHPDLFPPSILDRCLAVDHIHLRYCHGIQTSSDRLAAVLRRWNSNVFVVENAVHPIPPFHFESNPQSIRLFLGNFNREFEQKHLVAGLMDWFQVKSPPTLVTVGPSGLEGLLPLERTEKDPPLPYANYRSLLATCHMALLPLRLGEPQASKTPIKWLEASAESVAVIAGPELYGPYLENGKYGLFAPKLEEVIYLARKLASNPKNRLEIVKRAHSRAHDFHLAKLIEWRSSLYQHLCRMSGVLEISLQNCYPECQIDHI